MPWRGPAEKGEYPTLGYDVADWIQAWCRIPDGYRRGDPFVLTDEQLRFVLRFYRLHPKTGALVYFGGQLRRAQKWGKDPLGAAVVLAEALGPARFDGWNADGEPVGAPYPTPYIPVLGVSEDQTDNTYKPLLEMIRIGPLIDLPGMDAGETRTELPNSGTIDPVTSSPRSRLGQRMTFATLTESHLMTPSTGGRTLAGAVKRNLAGMDGRWLELTNGWDPSERSEAQATGEGNEAGVLIDTVESHRVEDLDNDEDLRTELERQYGDSATSRGGWVNLDRITSEIRSPRVADADARRFFLNELVEGTAAFVHAPVWDALADFDDPLRPGDRIALGFDGSRSDDATALIACRKRDGRLFQIGVWERDEHVPDWTVPRAEVRTVVAATFDAYDVGIMFGDPWKWENDLDGWANTYGEKVVVAFHTNVEQRMDRAIHRFLVAVKAAELSHDGADEVARHVKNAVLAKGSKKKARDPDDPEATHYRKVIKKKHALKIDAAVAAILAYEGAMTMPDAPAELEPLGAWR